MFFVLFVSFLGFFFGLLLFPIFLLFVEEFVPMFGDEVSSSGIHILEMLGVK
jgi:hypothetical protein